MIKEKILKFKIPLIIITILIILITSLITTKEEEFDEPVIEKEKTKKIEKTKPKESTIKVDLKGEVNAIGVYEMKTGERISDLINKAGGLTKNADTSLINLSKKLEDQMVIIIYSRSEVNKMKSKSQAEITCPEVNDGCITTEKAETLIDKPKQTTKTTTSTQININTANEEELQTLNGIGESRAKTIIEYRNKNGKFEKIEDIKNVSGIGDGLYEKIKSNITV